MGPYPKTFKTQCPFWVHAAAIIYQLFHQNMIAMSSF